MFFLRVSFCTVSIFGGRSFGTAHLNLHWLICHRVVHTIQGCRVRVGYSAIGTIVHSWVEGLGLVIVL